MNKTPVKNTALGLAFGLSAAFTRGFVPLYWKQVSHVSALELLGHRIVWGLLTLGIIIFIQKGWSQLKVIIQAGDRWLVLSSILVFANWGLFIWAVNKGMVVDASLGYYLAPLFNILTGYFFLGENMRPLKIQAIVLAAIGVLVLFFMNSGNPEISLVLAVTFSFYGYLKKKSALASESALFFEFSFWFFPVLIYFIYLASRREFIFVTESIGMQFVLFLAGAITILPLWLYNNALKHLDLGTVGFLHYITPSLQLVLGVLIYKESFDENRLLAFGLIWMGIIFYVLDSIKNRRADAVKK